MIYRDRRAAGRTLAGLLRRYADRDDVVVLGLPRGGVPVAFEVAEALGAPLDVFVVRKLGVPGHEELAMGAIASGGVRVLLPDIFRHIRRTAFYILNFVCHLLSIHQPNITCHYKTPTRAKTS